MQGKAQRGRRVTCWWNSRYIEKLNWAWKLHAAISFLLPAWLVYYYILHLYSRDFPFCSRPLTEKKEEGGRLLLLLLPFAAALALYVIRLPPSPPPRRRRGYYSAYAPQTITASFMWWLNCFEFFTCLNANKNMITWLVSLFVVLDHSQPSLMMTLNVSLLYTFSNLISL